MSRKARVIHGCEVAGLDVFVPVVRLLSGEEPSRQIAEFGRSVGIPLLALGVFLLVWAGVASQIETSIGRVPGPAAVWEQGKALVGDHYAERTKEAQFYERMEGLKEKYAEEGRPWKDRRYSGKPTFLDQVGTSLATV